MINIIAGISPVIWISLGAAVLILLLFVAAPLWFIGRESKKVYFRTLVRTDKEKWKRVCSAPDNEEQVRMWEEGLSWARENASRRREVEIRSHDSLRLCGELYDFGGDKCVIILPGRCECLYYSYFFAKPYSDMGMSVLVIDSRCHGESEGAYTTIGRDEGADAKAWAQYLFENEGIDSVWLHGVCVGSAGAFVCARDSERPHYIKGIVAEGPYTTFRETFKRHLIEGKHPVFPVLGMVMSRIKKHAGVDYRDVAPIKLVREMSCPILYIFGEKDIFSIPSKSRELFEATKSPEKEIVWFSCGGHSHLRINNREEYDEKIKQFVRKHEKI